MNLPEDYPHEESKVSFEWYAPYRYQRIAEVLGGNLDFAVQDSVELQTDYLSVPARRIIARLEGLRSTDPKLEQALRMLRGWDHVLAADSSPAALFEVWYRAYLRPALIARAVADVVPEEKRDEAVTMVTPVEDQAGDARVDLDLIENREGRLGPESERSRDEVLLTSLKLAFEHLERLLGADVRLWEWGKLHHAFLAHPLSPLLDERTRERLNVGPAPRGGNGDTVGNTAYDTDDFRQTGGSSWRVVLDVGNWDGCLAMNAPGQSGDPGSPHYADLFSRWAADEAVPLLYSREKIEAAAEKRIVLRPVG